MKEKEEGEDSREKRKEERVILTFSSSRLMDMEGKRMEGEERATENGKEGLR